MYLFAMKEYNCTSNSQVITQGKAEYDFDYYEYNDFLIACKYMWSPTNHIALPTTLCRVTVSSKWRPYDNISHDSGISVLKIFFYISYLIRLLFLGMHMYVKFQEHQISVNLCKNYPITELI